MSLKRTFRSEAIRNGKWQVVGSLGESSFSEEVKLEWIREGRRKGSRREAASVIVDPVKKFKWKQEGNKLGNRRAGICRGWNVCERSIDFKRCEVLSFLCHSPTEEGQSLPFLAIPSCWVCLKSNWELLVTNTVCVSLSHPWSYPAMLAVVVRRCYSWIRLLIVSSLGMDAWLRALLEYHML